MSERRNCCQKESMSQPPAIPEYSKTDPPAVVGPAVPVSRRRFAPGEILSWLVVIAMVVLTAVAVAVEQFQQAGTESETGETQLTLSAKYGIGVNALFHLPGTDAQLLAQLEN